MARARRTLVLLALLLATSAFAGVFVIPPVKLTAQLHGLVSLPASVRPTAQLGGRPPTHGRQAAPTTLRGQVYALHAVTQDGLETEIPIEPGMDLSDPLPVAPDAVELLIELDGPVWVEGSFKNSGRILWEAHPETLRVVLEDPDEATARGWVRLEADMVKDAGVDQDELVVIE